MPHPRIRSAIPLFDRLPHHSFVPTKVRTAVARSGGPGRPTGRRSSALPWTGASTMVVWRRVGLAVSLMTAVASFGLSAPVPAVAQSVSFDQRIVLFDDLIDEAARRFGVPGLWIRFVMRSESAGDARAVSPKGAIGLMQIMPQTYARLREVYGLGADPFEPRDNILAGAAYLREMYDRYGTPGFLAAYNAGPGRYETYLATGRTLPEETRLYLDRLAPLIAGAQAGRVETTADPFAWAAAPLFVRRADPAADIANATALQPHSDGLFLPRGSKRESAP
jgi:Transglycosylase SLT domain